MNTKKAALVYNWTLTFMVIGILAWALLQFASKYNQLQPLGTKQLVIFKTYSKAESTLFYIDQSSKYALQQAVYELAKNGGTVSEFDIDELDTSQPFVENECGKFNGAYLWYQIKKDTPGNNLKKACFEENSLTTNALYYFDGNLNKYMTNSPYDIPHDNYDYKVSDSLQIIGKAYSPIIFNILKEEKPVVKQPSEFKSPETKENFVDFTGTELCAKGRKCLLTKESYDLLLKAQEIANKYKVTLQVTYGYRTLEEQNRLWQKNPNSQLVCRPDSNCPHLSGKSVDIILKEKTDWPLLYKIMAEAGWIRYAQKGDEHHFECCGTDRYLRAKAEGKTEII